jgi:hypothetical protein
MLVVSWKTGWPGTTPAANHPGWPGGRRVYRRVGVRAGVRRALFAYNPIDWYVNDVLYYAARYDRSSGLPDDPNNCRSRVGDPKLPSDLIFWDSYLGPTKIAHVMIIWNPATKTTIEARNTRAGVGHFSYANAPSHHIFEIWRVRKVAGPTQGSSRMEAGRQGQIRTQAPMLSR